MPEMLPKLVWAQRFDKVFVTFEQLNTKNVKVTFSEGLLSLEAETETNTYKLENMSLWSEIDTAESKWSANDRSEPFCLPVRLGASAPCHRDGLLPHSFRPSLLSSHTRLFPQLSLPSLVSPVTRLSRHSSLPSLVSPVTCLLHASAGP
jgi:hypothetical protein